MRDRKRWKGLVALAMSVAMLFSQTVAYAQEGQPVEQMEDLGQIEFMEEAEAVNGLDALSVSAQADDDGFVIEDGVLTKYTGTDTEVVVPDGVTSIARFAFHGCSSLTDITLPSSVTIIGDYAFDGCSSLTDITLPSSVTIIGDYAFDGCGSLTDITLPSSVTNVGDSAFKDCSSLTDITLPSSVTSIGDFVFDGCSSLSSVKIPAGVTSIGIAAFDGCSSLSSVEIPAGVTSIGNRAFDGCSSLADINVSAENSEYASYAGCVYNKDLTQLKIVPSGKCEVRFSEKVTSIGGSAFYNCTSLANIAIPNGVTSIGSSAFSGCDSLTDIALPESVTSIGDYCAFAECSSLRSIIIPNGVTSIGESTFQGCSSLSSITIPNSVTVIGYAAFAECSSLANIAIPNSVTSIGDSAFAGCSSLSSITIPNSVTVIGDFAFGRYSEELTIYGTSGSYAETYAAENNIKFSTGTPPQTEQPAGKKTISSSNVTVSSASYTYDGTAKTPSVTVKDGTNTLKSGTDYTVTYADNTNAGTARVTVTGRGNYTGTVTKNFTIQKADQKFNYTKSYSKAYGSKAFTLNAKLKAGNGKLTYATSNKKVATVKNGKVTVTGTGAATITVKAARTANYNAASVTVTIKASPAKQTLKSLKAVKGRKLTVTWKKDTRATGYQIQYSTDKNFKKGVKTATVSKYKTVSKTITKLTKGKRYYVRVRSYKSAKVSGKTQTLYGAWSGAKRSGSIKK